MTETIYYSSANNAFYLDSLLDRYELEPDSLIIVDSSVFDKFTGQPPDGKQRAVGDDGLPCWADIPPLTEEELKTLAESEKRQRIAEANAFINSQQWPSRLALKRLSETEEAVFASWLDYLDALNAVDTETAPDIEWPTPPAVQAR
ncbi:tail fiber assembly protein [Escherichia coli]|nr:tail fiber assembly protein [Escherichia coli]